MYTGAIFSTWPSIYVHGYIYSLTDLPLFIIYLSHCLSSTLSPCLWVWNPIEGAYTSHQKDNKYQSRGDPFHTLKNIKIVQEDPFHTLKDITFQFRGDPFHILKDIEFQLRSDPFHNLKDVEFQFSGDPFLPLKYIEFQLRGIHFIPLKTINFSSGGSISFPSRQ